MLPSIDANANADVRRAEVAPAAASEHAEGASEDGGGEGMCVRVLDAAGAPIGGASVSFQHHDEVPPGRTDDEGRCRLPTPFEVSRGVVVAVEAEGFHPGLEFALQGHETEIRLHRATRLAGRALERESRAPIAGARVVAALGHDDGESRAVVTDAGGWFADLGVPEGTPFRLGAIASGYLAEGWKAQSLVIQPGETDVLVELLLDRSLVRELQVLDSEDDEPVAGVTVSCRGVGHDGDADGRVVLDRCLDPAQTLHELYVEAPGHCRTNFDVDDLGDGSAPIVVRLPRACRLVGEVLDGDGEPMTGVNVVARLPSEVAVEVRRTGRPPSGPLAARWPENARWAGTFQVGASEVSDEGRFELAELAPGLAELELAVSRGNEVLARRSFGPLGGPGSESRLVWQVTASQDAGVRGRLLLNGEPHRGSVTWTQGERRNQLQVGEDGVFSIDDLAAGPVELRGGISSPMARWGAAGSVTRTIEAEAGRIVEVDLALEYALSAIEGRIVDARGEPVPERWVAFFNDALRAQFGATSAADGSWRVVVADVPESYRILDSQPIREEGLEVQAGAKGIVLHELDHGRLRIRARDATTRELLPPVMVTRRLANGQARIVVFPGRDAPDSSGWTECELHEGEHLLGAYTGDRDFTGAPQRVVIAPGATTEVEFQLAPSLTLDLRLAPELDALANDHALLLLKEAEWGLVSAELGEGRPNVSLRAVEFDPGRMRDVHLRPGRPFALRGLAPGRHRFKVFPDDVAIEPEVVDVPAEGVVEVRWSQGP
ncbi:MAG TPA: carboxypeptidase-like regulatory domain-containing protein [Planctomycetota bacterium]|nr:carboxypeptidase-like regulatory domain-containing protein [Planctomycetota bacterium]